MGRRTSRAHAETGQYMVEFGFAFIFVIATLLGALQLILVGYNYNMAERTAWEAARAVSVGRRDAETQMMPNDTGVFGIVQRNFLDKVFTGGFMTVDFARDFGESPIVSPETEIWRGEGQTVTVDLSYRSGFYIPGLGTIVTITFPVKAKMPIVAYNDFDRDGCVDSLEGTVNSPFVDTGPTCRGFTHAYRNDHDNDGVEDLAITDGNLFYMTGQADDDADGIANVNDSGVIRTCGNPLAGHLMYFARPVLGNMCSPGDMTMGFFEDTGLVGAGGVDARYCVDQNPNDANSPFNDGMFASHLFYVTSSRNIVEDDWHWLPRELPWGQQSFYGGMNPLYPGGVGAGDCVTLFVDLHYDKDNDGWEDRSDRFQDDYTRH